nr:unnamed protein product [Spirometra erinaceieuropaei]
MSALLENLVVILSVVPSFILRGITKNGEVSALGEESSSDPSFQPKMRFVQHRQDWNSNTYVRHLVLPPSILFHQNDYLCLLRSWWHNANENVRHFAQRDEISQVNVTEACSAVC